MRIYKTAQFQIKAESMDICLRAIQEFVEYIKDNEPGTLVYLSLQEDEDPTKFLHYFAFEDGEAEKIHRTSEAVNRFTNILYPELVSDGTEFTNYKMVSTT